MTLEESFKQWSTKHDLYDLPWQIDAKVLHDAFSAGWLACADERKVEVAAALKHCGKPVPSPAVLAYKGDSGSIPLDFPAMIYAAYPRHTGKLAALKAIQKAIKAPRDEPYANDYGNTMTAPDWLLMKTLQYARATATWPSADQKFIPHPATWFNQGRYDDDQKEWLRGAAAMPSQFSKTNR